MCCVLGQTLCLSPTRNINVTGQMSGKPDEMLGSNLAMDWHPIQVGVVILLVAPCEGNRDTIKLDGPQFR